MNSKTNCNKMLQNRVFPINAFFFSNKSVHVIYYGLCFSLMTIYGNLAGAKEGELICI